MIDSALSTLVRLGLWAERTSKARSAARLAPRLVRHTAVEPPSPIWLAAGLLALIATVVGLALLDGFPAAALLEDDLTAAERVSTKPPAPTLEHFIRVAGTLWSW